jgi:secondary thiamine-phosphate synthase enzyme
MQTHRSHCSTHTEATHQLVDITQRVAEVLVESGITAGQVTVSAERGCAIVVNELETGLAEDIKHAIRRLDPSRNGLASTVGSSAVVLPAADGKLSLGTWQRVLLLELGTAGNRTVTIQIVGE